MHAKGSTPLGCMLMLPSYHYLVVRNADITLYEAILLFCGLENEHSELLHPLGVISRPVLVAHLL